MIYHKNILTWLQTVHWIIPYLSNYDPWVTSSMIVLCVTFVLVAWPSENQSKLSHWLSRFEILFISIWVDDVHSPLKILGQMLRVTLHVFELVHGQRWAYTELVVGCLIQLGVPGPYWRSPLNVWPTYLLALIAGGTFGTCSRWMSKKNATLHIRDIGNVWNPSAQ